MSTIASVSLAFVAMIWGSSYLVIKDILDSVPPFIYLAIRYLMAIPVVFFMFRRDVVEWLSQEATTTLIVRNFHPGMWLGVAFGLQAHGLQNMGPGKAALFTALVFLFIPAVEFLGGEKIQLLRLAPMLILASFGVSILAKPWLYGVSTPDMLIVLCAVAFSFHIFLTGRVRISTHFAVVFVLQGLVVLLISVLGWMLTEMSLEFSLSVTDWLRIGYVALIVTAGCYLIQFAAQRYVRPRYVGLIFALEPVVALLLSTALGYEILSTSSIIGSAAILASVFMAVMGSAQDLNDLK